MNKKEVAAFVRNNVEDYEERLQLALKRMDRMRTICRPRDRYGRESLCRAASGAVEIAPPVPSRMRGAGV